MTYHAERGAPPIQTVLSRIVIAEPGGCWIWPRAVNTHGYGVIRATERRPDGRRGPLLRVHRVVWEAVVGPIPPGGVLDHRCRERRCCCPDHLDLVVPIVNTARRGEGALCSHCLGTGLAVG